MLMLCFFEEITKWIDEGSPVDIINLAFQKAFDKVPHQRWSEKWQMILNFGKCLHTGHGNGFGWQILLNLVKS